MNMLKSKPAMTLLELILVVVVIGIISGFAVPGYLRARNRALVREAQAMLALIRAAEQARDAEGLGYVACANTAACNAALNLDLSDQNWDYSVDTTVPAGGFTATASGQGNNSNPDQTITNVSW
jgi:prepilin-type N-terminal cleavage/methylation domain-containing protein